MSVKITKLTAENIKRIRAVQLEPSESGLTVIGGDNNQGKTSVLDAICWTLGGDRFRPSQPTREGSAIPPHIRIELSNGLIVERSGKNGSLKVTDPNGRTGGQQLLNSFVEQLALDLPRFMQSSGREKARTLLQIIGVDEQLAKLEREEHELYNERLAVKLNSQIAECFLYGVFGRYIRIFVITKYVRQNVRDNCNRVTFVDIFVPRFYDNRLESLHTINKTLAYLRWDRCHNSDRFSFSITLKSDNILHCELSKTKP